MGKCSFPMACPTCFPRAPRTTCPGVAPSQGAAPSHTGQSVEAFSQLRLSYLSYVTLIKKLKSPRLLLSHRRQGECCPELACQGRARSPTVTARTQSWWGWRVAQPSRVLIRLYIFYDLGAVYGLQWLQGNWISSVLLAK